MLLMLPCVKKQLALESPWDVAVKCDGRRFQCGKGMLAKYCFWRWVHPILLSTIRKTCVLLNDPDLGYSSVSQITCLPCVNATSAITNAFEKEGCHQERFIQWDMFVLGTQMQQQNPGSLCCPFPMAGAERGPPGAPHCAGFPHQPRPCPSKPHVLMHWSSS